MGPPVTKSHDEDLLFGLAITEAFCTVGAFTTSLFTTSTVNVNPLSLLIVSVKCPLP